MKKLIKIVLGCVLLFPLGCSERSETDPARNEDRTPETQYEVLVLNTSFGDIYLHLYHETPFHKENFDSLVRAQFYDGTEFHRLVDDFVIQGGSSTSKDDDRTNDGNGGTGYTIPAEINPALYKHKYGAIGAARQADGVNPQRRSNGSQFYIVTNLAGTPHLDGAYTVFGEVLLGMDVAKAIEGAPKDGNNLPYDRIPMTISYQKMTQTQLDEKGIVIP